MSKGIVEDFKLDSQLVNMYGNFQPDPFGSIMINPKERFTRITGGSHKELTLLIC